MENNMINTIDSYDVLFVLCHCASLNKYCSSNASASRAIRSFSCCVRFFGFHPYLRLCSSNQSGIMSGDTETNVGLSLKNSFHFRSVCSSVSLGSNLIADLTCGRVMSIPPVSVFLPLAKHNFLILGVY